MTGTIFLESSQLSIGEADGFVFIPIVRTGDLSGTAVIDFGITPNTATENADYTGGSGTVTMAAGQARVLVPVQIINDSASETTETFTLSIINVDSGSTLLFPRTARIDILDNENPVVDPPNPPLSSNYQVTQQPVIIGLTEPMAFEFAPQDSSLVYIAEKGGRIRVFDLDTGSYLPDFVDLTAQVNNIQDRGLMDIALHPNFPQQPYLYAFYVVDPPETASHGTELDGRDGAGNRFAYVVRLTADAATGFTTIVPGSQVILLGGAGQTLQDISGGGAIDSTTNITQPESGFNAQTGVYLDNYIKVDSRSHAGGSLAFGPDGALYVSVGDGASFDTTDPRGLSVQDIDSLSGKILRVDPITGLGLPDNPFVQPGDSLSANHSKVYQLGLRNPFSMGFDQDGHLIITNTGWFSWEEIESGPPGANFGWPYYEGGDNGVILPTPGYESLPSAAAFYSAVNSGQKVITPAIRSFAHASSEPGFQNQAITGGDVVYTGSRYPLEFQNDFFFTDIVDGEVFVVDVNDRRDVKFLYQATGAPVHFSQGPDGYVYYADLFTGVIGRLLIEPLTLGALVARGSTTYDAASNTYTLTAAGNEAGTVMSSGRIDLRQNFAISLQVYLGTNDSGADGLAFVLHNDPAGVNAIGAAGSGLAIGGIRNGLAIEFDTYASGPGDIVSGPLDIASDHTGFLDTDSSSGTTPFALPNIENGQFHNVTITWNATTQTLSYTFDGQQVGTLNANVVATYLGGSDFAYFGVGAGTGGLSNDQRVQITNVNATFEGQTPDNGPVAVADTATTPAGTPVNINVLANDSDPNGDALTIIAVSDPPHGTVAINANNTPSNPADDFVTFTPDPGFIGSDSFTYTVSDGTLARLATVSVTVTAPPAPFSLTPRGSTTYDAASNTYTLTAAGNEAGTVMSSGRIDLRQNFAISLQVYLGTNDSGADGLAFVLHNDPAGVNAIGAAGSGLAIGGIRNGLAIEFDTYASGPGDIVSGPLDIASDHTGFLDTDSSSGTTPFALPNIENGQFHNVTITWNATTQTLSYTFDGQQVGTLNANVVATYLGGSDFAYFGVGAGTGGLSNDQRVQITNVNATFEGQPPSGAPTAVADSAATSAATPVDINVLANDTDPNGDALSITGVGSTTGTAGRSDLGATLAITGSGANQRVNYDGSTAPQIQAIGPGATQTDQFSYSISDGNGGTATAIATITVAGVNDPPSITSNGAGQSAAIAVAENTTAVTTVTAVDPDVGQSLTFAIVGGADAAQFTLNPTTHALEFLTAPDFEAPADANGDNVYNVTVQVSDGAGGIDSQQIAVSVTDIAENPTPPAQFSLTPRGSTTYDAASNTYTLTTAGNEAGTVMSSGRIDLRQNFAISLQVYLGTNDSGADGLAFVLHNDPAGVNAIGAAGSGLAIGGIRNGLAIEFDTYASGPGDIVSGPLDIASDHTGFLDTDSSSGTTPFALPNIENGQFHNVTITWNATTQTLSYTFDGQQVGTLNANVVATYLGGSHFAYFGVGAGTGGLSNDQRVRIANVNATLEGQLASGAPVITSNGGDATAAISLAENTAAVTALMAVDPDVGQSLVYSLVGGADAARFTLDPATHVLAFLTAPDFEAPGDANGDNVYNVTVQVSDGAGGVDSQQIAVTVTNVDGISPPASNAATITGSSEDDVLTGQGGANTINGLAGNDTLSGAGGNDTLNGGFGNDTLTGGTGNDTLNGNEGSDVFRYTFGHGADTVNGGAGTDTLNTTGTTANDTLDVVYNGTALTNFEGGTIAAVESVTVDLLGGTDTLTYAGTSVPVSVDLALGTASGFTSIANIENVTGGSGNDTLVGNAQVNAINGGNGVDRITGAGGDDALNGGTGNDTFVFAPGFGRDTITGFDHDPAGGQDLLDISAFGITAATFASRVTIADPGSDIVVTIDGNANQVINLAGVPSTANITAADFVLFP